MKNLDHLFDLPERPVWAVPDSPLFNTGVMVIVPSELIFRALLGEFATGKMQAVKADQGVINEFFATTWGALPDEYNCLSHTFSVRQQRFLPQKWTIGIYTWPNVRKRVPVADAYVIHFTDTPKPWADGFDVARYADLFDIWKVHAQGSSSAAASAAASTS